MAIDESYFDELLFLFVSVSPWDEEGFYGRVRPATPLERALFLLRGRRISFVVEISREVWDGLDEEGRILLLAHLLSSVVLRTRGVNPERLLREPRYVSRPKTSANVVGAMRLRKFRFKG